ncbi:hypothetical protein SAY87_021527 [Trapa incisa]|uniref:Uncharacterized protein n=1 Tax=Trapa incisa TaxID=236973 RepID=A0AAN7JTC0_9MYRT|nr:hypothetical protein SAY87_021527 [Trapa incisa]
MGFFTYAVAGGGLFLLGAVESLAASNSPSPGPSLTLNPSSSLASSKPKISSSSFSYFLASVISFLFILDSLISFFAAINSQDQIGSALQLQSLAVSALFLFFSVLGILIQSTKLFPFPLKLLNSILLFAFAEEFLLFYLQRKDTSGIENRYFVLMLVPVTVCTFSTVLELKSQKAQAFARLGRGIGLILQGTWFLQMSVSFFTKLVAQGCWLHEYSRGNYTVKCKGHPEYHRARAIATLQFNCHLALLVAVTAGAYSILAQRNGIRSDGLRYRPLGEDAHDFGSNTRFTLDSDGEDGDGIKEESSVGKIKESVGGDGAVEMSINGHGIHY